MGLLDQLFGNNAAPAAAAPTVTAPTVNPTQAQFIQNLLASTNSGISAKAPSQRGLLNWLSGADRQAATDGATASAPALWDAFKQAQAGSQGAQLGTARDFATTGAMAGTNVDPNDPMASVPALTAAYAGAAGPNSGAPAENPVQAQRALYLRLGRMFSMQPGQAPMANEFFKLANQGVPDGTSLAGNGAVSDAINGQAIKSDVGTLLAGREGMKAAADANSRLPAALTSQTHQGNVDIGVHTANANTDATHTLVNGIDTNTGKPVMKTQAELLAGGKNSTVSSNPYFDGQQAELKELRTKNESADQGLNLATQISNAANGVFTGKGANAFQNARKLAQTAAQLTGAKLDPSIDNDASKFEQLKFASQQLVAVASHDLSPRVAMNIYNQIAAVKPGDQTSVKGLRDIINKELIPVFQRNKALYTGTSNYYQKNPLTNDAAAHVSDQNPISNFGVKDVGSAQVGDYFIDPQTGNLRQRNK